MDKFPNKAEAIARLREVLTGSDWRDHFFVDNYGEWFSPFKGENGVNSFFDLFGAGCGDFFSREEADKIVFETLCLNVTRIAAFLVSDRIGGVHIKRHLNRTIGLYYKPDGSAPENCKTVRIVIRKDDSDKTKLGLYISAATPSLDMPE